MATEQPKTACASCTQTGHARQSAEKGCLQEVLSLAESLESVLNQALVICSQPMRGKCAILVAHHMWECITSTKMGLVRYFHALCPQTAESAMRNFAKWKALAHGMDVLYSESTGTDEAIAAGIEEINDLMDGGMNVFALSKNTEVLEALEDKWDCIIAELRDQYGIDVPYDLVEKTEEIYADLEAEL